MSTSDKSGANPPEAPVFNSDYPLIPQSDNISAIEKIENDIESYQNDIGQYADNNSNHRSWGYGGDEDVEELDFRPENPSFENIESNQNEEADEDDDGNVHIPGVDDLPLFSNQITKKLNNQIREKEKNIVEYENKIVDLRERVKIIKDHFKNVQSELHLTNNLHNSKKLEIQTEKHLQMLTTRALEKEKSLSKNLKADIEQVQENLNSVQNTIYLTKQKLDEFKLQMNFNQNELEQWILASKQKEEDNAVIAKYSKIDEQKIKDLSFELEKLTKELTVHKEKLDGELVETQAKQMELDRIAVDFKNAHTERKDLIGRWQDIINEMKKRDADINLIGERFAKAKSERIHREQLVNVQRERLTQQQNVNKEIESKFESLSRIVVRKREELIEGSLKLQEFRDELESLKNVLTSSAETLVIKRKLNVSKSQLVEDRKSSLEAERDKYQLAKEKLEFVKASTDDVEVSARNAEDILLHKEKQVQVNMSKVKEAKERLFKESQQVYESKREETRLKNEVSGAKLIMKNLDASLVQLDREASRQQELLYNAEFQIQQIERKISRGMGERSDDEKRDLKIQIEENERILSEVKDKKKVLMSQSRKLSNELAMMKLRKDESLEKKVKLKEKLGEKEIENKTISEEIKHLTKENEDLTVQNDLHRLDVKRLKDLLSAKADVVFSLENRRQQLVLSMEERKTEIAVHRDVLKAELKTIQEEKHNFVMDLRNREAQIEKLKARFNALSTSSSNGEGKDGEMSQSQFQSFYIIQAAQRREELTRRGDELDFQIRQCERELRAQQLTLDHLNARNAAFRDSFKKVDNNSEDAEMVKQYEEQVKLVKDQLFRKKKEMQRLIADSEEDERRLEQVKNQYIRVSKQKENYDNAKRQVEEELLTQQSLVEDLNTRVASLISKHRSSSKRGIDANAFDNNTSLEEKSAYAEVAKDCVQNVLYTLGQLSSEFPEIGDYLNERLRDAELRIPAKPPSRGKPQNVSQEPVSSKNSVSKKSITATSSASPLSLNSQNGSTRNRSSIVLPSTNFAMDF